MEEDRLNRIEKKNNYHRMAEEDLQRKYGQLNEYQRNQMNEKEEYNILCQRNSMKQQLKEDNYRNYYRMCMEDQNQRGNQFKKNVLTKIEEKEQAIQNKILANMDEYQRKRYMDELNRLKLKMMQNAETTNFLKKQMEEKEHMRQLEKMEKNMQVDNRLKELSNYNSYLSSQKREKMDNANQYKNLLDFQSEEANINRLNANRMTRNEKKQNIHDLHAYKEIQPDLHAMIPGFAPQLGGVSNRVNPESVVNQAMARVKQHSQSKVPIKSQPELGMTNQSAIHLKQNVQTDQNTWKNASVHESLSKPTGPKQRYNESYKYGHNPITNPMPFNVQNPYIANQIDKAQGGGASTRRGVFGQVANKNLIS